MKILKLAGTIPALALVGLLGMSADAQASTIITNQTFETDPPLSATQEAGKWYTDRFAPAGFESEVFMGDERLAHTISEDDGATGRPSSFSSGFYNTQGRKFDTPGATRLSIDMFIAPEFEDVVRIGGLWGTGINAGGDISSFPIIEFFDNQFQVFDSIDDADSTGFRAVGTQAGFAFGQFATLAIELDTTADIFSFFVDNELLHTEEAGGTVSIANAILQNVNTTDGVNRTIYFDNFTATGPAPIPLPAAGWLLLTAFGGLGIAARRRKAA